MSCFETETDSQLVEGLGFHKFYFDNADKDTQSNSSIDKVNVQIMGTSAYVSFERIVTVRKGGPNSAASFYNFNETRVWQLHNGRWKHVHMHRSPVS